MSLERMLERETELNDSLTEKRIADIRGSVPAQKEGPENCPECGDKIPAKRRQAGYGECVFCVESRERSAGGRR